MNNFITQLGAAGGSSRWAWIGAAGLALATGVCTVALSRESAAHPGEASGFERRCVGSYLVLEEASQALTIWTFHGDRTLVSTSSGELLFAFGAQHGSWRPEGRSGATAVQLDFDWDVDGNLEAIGRVDIAVEAGDASCETLTGSFEGRLFPPGEDPLDIGDTPALFGDTISGQRILAP
jgi:hypothetical protein